MKYQGRGKEDPEFRYSRNGDPAYKRWTFEENFRYTQFLQNCDEKEGLKEDKRQGKTMGFYVHMASEVGTKNNSQCRTHHLKMLKTHQTKENIIKNFALKQETHQAHKNSSSLIEDLPLPEEKELQKAKASTPARAIDPDLIQQITFAEISDNEQSFFDVYYPPFLSYFSE